ncbi:hypothetical protein PHYBLDRAFT_169232 [Phycomyces blakesleeanus NRRL 1555(-)]|uniref:Uncharacterized protein n=1 Tax=Phycomyces blakesleeanus (strain ATCC 8743b / DSM 1359 / FGSC 10004 / NBRC 33097 / NRRL 1555) TaxID=763407 RepID=A0A162U2M7_PHYB8|nr:hypothetical protein PHYBLDRAFT_169232 [Phycomyces blakesleeanus NRRL 1555(-)]OAD72972.1 hypothetical protein PHYBLDRAFT_169232 [Phycomyces blakesleeanus NRRL 1555(-)]|eukprot:XP_018291012.1 hypothetical protein PHYBLDRAFT_169232 [Phycomyces blakesleeanus NRRL 1555(-)]
MAIFTFHISSYCCKYETNKHGKTVWEKMRAIVVKNFYKIWGFKGSLKGNTLIKPVYVYTSGPASEFIEIHEYFGELLNCFFSRWVRFFCVFGFAADLEAQEQDMEHRWTLQGGNVGFIDWRYSICSSSISISINLSSHKPHMRFKSVKILRVKCSRDYQLYAQGHKNHGACKYMLSEMLLLQTIFLKSIYKKHLNREKLNLNATAADALIGSFQPIISQI